jgi:hypothetical protein
MRCTVIFRERVATFKIGKLDFLSELQPRGAKAGRFDHIWPVILRLSY